LAVRAKNDFLVLEERTGKETYGGKRIKFPQETVQEVQEYWRREGYHLVFRAFSDLYKIRIPIFFVRAVKSLETANDNNRLLSGMGKGLTDEYAKASAVMEMVERFSAGRFKEEDIIRAPYTAVRDKAVDPFRLLFSAEKDYTHDLEIDFTGGYSLTHRRKVLVPATFAYFTYNCRIDKGKIIHVRDGIKTLVPSNGLASGNCLEEAILHGLYEVIERDAVFIMWLNKLAMPDVDVSGVKNEHLRNILTGFNRAQVDLHIKYIPSDLTRAHTFFCLAVDRNHQNKFPAFSFGCGTHADPEIALSRAVTELGQILITIMLHRKNMNLPEYREHYDQNHRQNIKNFCRSDSLEYFHFLLEKPASIAFDQLVNHSNNNLKEEIEDHVASLHKKGFEVLVVPLTLPSLNIPVVRVLVPGLQSPVKKDFSRIYTDRLFTVPEKMGCPRKTAEELNSFELI